MIKNKVTLKDVEKIIDRSILLEKNIVFVCDGRLASYINTHVQDNYNIDSDVTMKICVDEYYVSLDFGVEVDSLIIEPAKGYNDYKTYISNRDLCVDYYIFLDLSVNVVNRCLLGKGTYSFWELIESNEIDKDNGNIDNNSCDYNDHYSECCNDLDDCICNDEEYPIDESEAEELRFIVDYAHKIIQNRESNENIVKTLVDMAHVFKNIGFADAKDIFKAFTDQFE